MRRSSSMTSLMRSSPPVTPASAMNDPISMWSGLIWCSQPWRSARPETVRTLEPIPWMSAPIFCSIRARSWTCGSHAALPMTVVPGIRAAASSAFSVPMTDGSSMKTSVARRPCGARRSMSRLKWKSAPRARNASRCGSSRRRPITSPPGGGITARPKRASRGPASRNDARMRSDSGRSTSTQSGLRSAGAERDLVLTGPRDAHAMWSSSPSIASTSLMRGTLRTTISSSVSTLAARMGRAPFLLPAGTTVPDNGAPPWMRNFSMSGRVVPAAEVVPKARRA